MSGKLVKLKTIAAVIGGLFLSTLVTLVLVPTLYTIFEERLARKPAPTPAEKM